MNKVFLIVTLIILSSTVNSQNLVSTYAGSTNGYADGDTSEALFKGPFGMCIDNVGNLYIADADNHCIRKITTEGIVSTAAGTGIAGYLDGIGSVAQFNSPSNLVADDLGNIYVSDFANQCIRKISFDGIVTTIAGSGVEGYLDGGLLIAQFDYPRGIVMDSNGDLFVCDSWNHRIRKIDLTNNNVMTFAGGGMNMGVSSEGDLVDGQDTAARFYTPSGLSIDEFDILYVADAYNHRIRQVGADGNVITIVGSGPTGPGNGGYADGDLLEAILNTPTEVFVFDDGKIYIGDTFNSCIRLFDGNVSTVAGNTELGYVDGAGDVAEFRLTRGVVADPSGEILYVCDYNNNRIRKIWLNVSVGVTDINSSIAIYPNPADDILIFQILEFISEYFKIQVTSLAGNIVLSEEFNNPGNYSIDVSQLNSGIYFACVYSNWGNYTRMIYIE